MKPYRWIVVVLLLTLSATMPVAADDNVSRSAGADIVRMWNARLSGDTILLFVRQSDLVFGADDVAVMAEAGLPDRFIRDLLKAAGRRDRDAYPLDYYPRYDPYYYGGYPWWFYGGHGVLDVHLGGHFGGHHYGSIGRHHSSGGHHYGSIGRHHSSGGHHYSSIGRHHSSGGHHYSSIGHGSGSRGFGHGGGRVSHGGSRGGGHHSSGGHGHH